MKQVFLGITAPGLQIINQSPHSGKKSEGGYTTWWKFCWLLHVIRLTYLYALLNIMTIFFPHFFIIVLNASLLFVRSPRYVQRCRPMPIV